MKRMIKRGDSIKIDWDSLLKDSARDKLATSDDQKYFRRQKKKYGDTIFMVVKVYEKFRKVPSRLIEYCLPGSDLAPCKTLSRYALIQKSRYKIVEPVIEKSHDSGSYKRSRRKS